MGRSSETLAIEGAFLSSGRIAPGRVLLRVSRRESGRPGDLVWRLAPDQLLIPAFHDHHTHFVSHFRPPQGPELSGCPSREACLARISAWLGENKGTTPVLGEGWDESIWEDRRPLRGEDLDAIESGRPIALRRVCGHRAVLNAAAWRLIAPNGEEADSGTGTVTESLALTLAQRWPSPKPDLVKGILRGQAEAFRAGVTAIDEMGRIETYEALRAVADLGLLRMRVWHYFPLDSLPKLEGRGIRPDGGKGPLHVAGLKAFLDGSIGARTAAIARKYEDAPGSGMLLRETPELIDLVRRGVASGYSVALHAIGARAVDQALTAFEAARPSLATGTMLRMEHAEELDDAAISRARASGVVLSMQPNFTARWQRRGQMYEQALGSERRLHLNRFASASAATRLFFGSDMMPFGPLDGLPGALDHPDPRERLTLQEALSAYATAGAGPPAATVDPSLTSATDLGAADASAAAGAGPGGAAGTRRTERRQNEGAEGRVPGLVVLWFPGGNPVDALRARTARVIWTALDGRAVYSDPDASVPCEFLSS